MSEIVYTIADKEWIDVHKQIYDDATIESITDVDVSIAWHLGLKMWLEAKKRGAKFPHE